MRSATMVARTFVAFCQGRGEAVVEGSSVRTRASMSVCSAEPIAPWGLMKNGTKTKWFSVCRWWRSQGAIVHAGSPSSSFGGSRLLCFQETAST